MPQRKSVLPRKCRDDGGGACTAPASRVRESRLLVMPDYLRPTALDDALAALHSRPLTVLAGGTDFYPARVGVPLDDDVLDITAVAVDARDRGAGKPLAASRRSRPGPISSRPTCRPGSTASSSPRARSAAGRCRMHGHPLRQPVQRLARRRRGPSAAQPRCRGGAGLAGTAGDHAARRVHSR